MYRWVPHACFILRLEICFVDKSINYILYILLHQGSSPSCPLFVLISLLPSQPHHTNQYVYLLWSCMDSHLPQCVSCLYFYKHTLFMNTCALEVPLCIMQLGRTASWGWLCGWGMETMTRQVTWKWEGQVRRWCWCCGINFVQSYLTLFSPSSCGSNPFFFWFED